MSQLAFTALRTGFMNTLTYKQFVTSVLRFYVCITEFVKHDDITK